MLPLVLIPAYQAAGHVGAVVRDLIDSASQAELDLSILVVDDGSTDDTALEARGAGALVVSHPTNLGKGAALLRGFTWAAEHGWSRVVTADADGQHPTEEILRMCRLPVEGATFVLGIRDLRRDGAPRNSQFSNAVSNLFLSWFTGVRLRDTQCGLRSYPVAETLALDCRDPGYAFEAEVLIRAKRAGHELEQVPIQVYYPPPSERLSHFHVVRDPAKIVFRVLRTVLGVL